MNTPYYEKAIEKIKENPLFRSFSGDDEHSEVLYRNCSLRKYKSGHTVAEEGEASTSLYILVSGKADIIKRTPSGDTYNAGTADDKDNFFFGESSLIRPGIYDFSVRASSDSEYLVLPGSKFRLFSENNPAVCLPAVFKIAELLSDKVKKVQNDMMTLYDALVHEIKS